METVSTALGIHLFGYPRLVWAGAAHKFNAPPRTIPLLALLLLNRGTHLARDTTSFMLWPDESEESARTNLRRHLNYLKNALPRAGEPWFVADAESVIWNDESAAWCDVQAFQSLVQSAGGLRDAVSLYAGDLLTGFYDDWLIVARERLRSQYIGALESLLLEARSRRDLPLAVEFSRRILSEDPWREDALRHLVSVRYEMGDRTGALHEFEQFAQRLHEDAGIEPMPETLALRDAVLRGAYLPESVAFRDEIEFAPGSGASSFPFVGRAAQLEQLCTAWTRAARGRGSLVLLSGEAGVGKSRMASELALIATAQGGRVLRGITPEPEQRPYQAIASALQGAAPMLASLDIRPVWLRAIAAILPEIEMRRAGLPQIPALDPQREQARLFEALLTALGAFSKQRPTLLILEDLHWAGVSSLAAVEYLARRAGMQSLLIVATFRGEEIAPGSPLSMLRRKLASDNMLSSIALAGLSQDEVCELVAQIPALAVGARETGRHIFEASGGNALFVCELLRDRIEAPEARAPGTNQIRETIAVRAGRLSTDARILADVASVIGATFDIDVVGQLGGLDESAVIDGLAELLDRRLIKEAGLGRFDFAFTHNLIAATLYEAVDPKKRRRWHRRLATLLEALPSSERRNALRSLGFHYEASGQAARAAGSYLEAAQQALAIFANDEALDYVQRALALPELTERLRFDLLLTRERASGARGDRAAQESDLEELGALAGALGDADSKCEVLRRRVRLARARSQIDREQQLASELADLAAQSGVPRRHAEALQERAASLRVANRFDEAYAAAHEARSIYEALGDEVGIVECYCLLSEIASTQGSGAEMQRFIVLARAKSLPAQNRVLIARSTMAASATALMQRDYLSAGRLAREALEQYREMGDREGEADAQSRYATALAMLNRLDDSRREGAAAASLYRELGKPSAMGYLLSTLSGTELQLGRLIDAQRSLEEAEAIFEALGDRRGRAVCWTNASMVALLRGDAPEARRVAKMALEGARELRSEVIEAAALSNLGNAERDSRHFEAAIAHMKEALAIRERMGHPGAFEELADLSLAQLESGDIAEAVATADGFINRARSSDENTVWPHYCFWVAARGYRAAGRCADAVKALGEAYAFMTEMLGAIEDPASRAAFLALPMNVGLVAAHERGEWPAAGSRAAS